MRIREVSCHAAQLTYEAVSFRQIRKMLLEIKAGWQWIWDKRWVSLGCVDQFSRCISMKINDLHLIKPGYNGRVVN